MTDFVDVVSKTTKQPQVVPAVWLEHPVLGADFTKTPAQRASDRQDARYPDGEPSETWKSDELKAYAEDKGVDLEKAKNKAEMVTAIAAAANTTPASGDTTEED